jgi:hypothetical protein
MTMRPLPRSRLPWRQGAIPDNARTRKLSVPDRVAEQEQCARRIFDAGDFLVCTCTVSQDAAFMVKAANSMEPVHTALLVAQQVARFAKDEAALIPITATLEKLEAT